MSILLFAQQSVSWQRNWLKVSKYCSDTMYMVVVLFFLFLSVGIVHSIGHSSDVSTGKPTRISLEGTDASTGCSALKVGETRRVNENSQSSPSGIPRKYVVKRLEDSDMKNSNCEACNQRYQVHLNLDFEVSKSLFSSKFSALQAANWLMEYGDHEKYLEAEPIFNEYQRALKMAVLHEKKYGSGYVGPTNILSEGHSKLLDLGISRKLKGAMDFIKGKFIKRFNHCIDQVNRVGGLKDEKGRALLFKVNHSSTKNSKFSLKHRIKIKSPSLKRSNSRNYAYGINCGTIMHELMHALGMVDEYVERDKAKIKSIGPSNDRSALQGFDLSNHSVRKFNCRGKVQGNSIMGNQNKFGIDKKVFGRPLLMCECPSHLFGDTSENRLTLQTTEALNHIYDRQKIANSCPKGCSKGRIIDYGTAINIDASVKMNDKYAYVVPLDRTLKVMRNIHFDLVTKPGCSSERHLTYYHCAKRAYKTVGTVNQCEPLVLNTTVNPKKRRERARKCEDGKWLD